VTAKSQEIHVTPNKHNQYRIIVPLNSNHGKQIHQHSRFPPPKPKRFGHGYVFGPPAPPHHHHHHKTSMISHFVNRFKKHPLHRRPSPLPRVNAYVHPFKSEILSSGNIGPPQGNFLFRNNKATAHYNELLYQYTGPKQTTLYKQESNSSPVNYNYIESIIRTIPL